MKWKTSSISVGAKIKHMPPERKPPKYPDARISQFTVINLMSSMCRRWNVFFFYWLWKKCTCRCRFIKQ
jgi:hypothetical protein